MDNSFAGARYGSFFHYVIPAAMKPDGSAILNADEAVDLFDAERFASDVASTGVEYAIVTAWHYRVVPLYPSRVMDEWLPGICPKRDLLGDIIDALRARGVAVILYTHPRDGHDFIKEDQLATGWGDGTAVGDTPNASFDAEKWNRFMLELYEELAERYAPRIIGVYTDGMGPFMPDSRGEYVAQNEETPVIIDYARIRGILKKHNPDCAIIQNYFGRYFTNDYGMPEGFFGYENKVPMWDWPASANPPAFQPFGSWTARAPFEGPDNHFSADDIARYAIFESTCAAAGGTCWAYGPYSDGSCEQVIIDTMRVVGEILNSLGGALKGSVPSKSFPTRSGRTLREHGGVCCCSSDDGLTEYVHVLDPALSVISLPLPADGRSFSDPEIICGSTCVKAFECGENGVIIELDRAASEFDTVIALRASGKAAPVWSYINDTDNRLSYRGSWRYAMLNGAAPDCIGLYNSDRHFTDQNGASVETWFEGETFGLSLTGDAAFELRVDGIPVDPDNVPTLGRGVHTLKIKKLSGGELGIDCIRIK